MIKNVVTFLTSLIAGFFHRNTERVCLRKVAAALLAFQVISMGAVMVHMSSYVHVHSSISGEVIHISADHTLAPVIAQPVVQSDNSTSDEDICELFNKLLRPSSAAQPQSSPAIDDETVVISHEIIARKLDIVYRSTRLLQQAPKNSPPSSIS